jgi:Ser/Thr protein kinase RdoA (MazF antagonist)
VEDYLVTSLLDSPRVRGGSWRARLELSPTGATAFDRDLVMLERRAKDMPNHRHVIHADLLNFNLLLNQDQVSVVIDWGCAMYGDAVYELA